MTGEKPPMEPGEWAALIALGAVSDDERRAFDALSAPDQQVVVAELSAMAPVVELLAESAAKIDPPDSVRTRLLARIAGAGPTPAITESTSSPQVWRRWESIAQVGDLFIRRADEGTWEPTGVDGVTVRQIFVDRDRNQMTALVRMTPGSSYPRHVHDGAEECLVLEGDLHVGDTVLRRGDYQRAPAGSKHGVQRTEQGCLLWINSSLSDEIF